MAPVVFVMGFAVVFVMVLCINDQPCRISPKKKNPNLEAFPPTNNGVLGVPEPEKKTIAGEVSPDPKHHTLIPPMASAMIASLGFKM